MAQLTSTKRPTKPAAAKEPLKHLLRTELILPHAAAPTAPGAPSTRGAAGEARERILRLRAPAEPRVGVGAEAVELVALLLVAEHAEGAGYHLEGLVGVLVAVLVGVRQQRLLAVGFLDLGVGARLLHLEDLVKGRRLASPDAQHRRRLLRAVLALLVALVVLAVARPAAAARGIGPGRLCAGHGARAGGLSRRSEGVGSATRGREVSMR